MLPQAVRYVLERLEDAGFAAYAVGGCVRDSLLGRTPHDWDLCTSALPEQVAEVPGSFTGQYLRPLLERDRAQRAAEAEKH